jgi:hypothetical protein
LRKDAFWRSPEANSAFRALTEALVLQLPAFDKVFIIECDPSGTRFGTVLHQGRGPIAFFNR